MQRPLSDKHNTPKRKISMSPARFEPTIAESEWQQIHALDLAATGFGTGLLHGIFPEKVLNYKEKVINPCD
jgi:hypothetical protein